MKQKSRIIAGFLSLMAGGVGAGRFYLGYYKVAVLQIALNIVTLGILGTLWGFFDGIMILLGKIKYDAKGNLLY